MRFLHLWACVAAGLLPFCILLKVMGQRKPLNLIQEHGYFEATVPPCVPIQREDHLLGKAGSKIRALGSTNSQNQRALHRGPAVFNIALSALSCTWVWGFGFIGFRV